MFGVVDRVALANKAQTRRLCALRPGFEMPLEAVLVAELDGRGPVILLCLGRREARKVLAWCHGTFTRRRACTSPAYCLIGSPNCAVIIATGSVYSRQSRAFIQSARYPQCPL